MNTKIYGNDGKTARRLTVAAFVVFFSLLLAAAGVVFAGGGDINAVKGLGHASRAATNPYSALNTAAQIVKIGDEYFIEDGYNGQIIYSDKLDAPLGEWKVMASGINRGHSVAGDGQYYMIDDTDNEKFAAFVKKSDGTFEKINEFKVCDHSPSADMSEKCRPHYVVYDAATKKFYGLVSMTGEIYVFGCADGKATHEKTLSVAELDGAYVRSFSIIDGSVYFVSGNNNILRVETEELVKSNADLKVAERFYVPDVMRSMVNIMKADGYWYITVSGQSAQEQSANAAILRTRDLAGLKNYEFENITHLFGGNGIPYYMSAFDGKYYVAMQNTNRNIMEFEITDGDVAAVRTLF